MSKKITLSKATLTEGAKSLGIKVTAKMTEADLEKKITENLEANNEELDFVCPTCKRDIPDLDVCPYCGTSFLDDEEEEEDEEEIADDENEIDEDSDDEEGDNEDSEELEDMSDEDLIALAEEKEIEVSYKGKGKNKKLDREALIEALRAEDAEDEEEDSEDEEKSLEEMTDDELVELAEEKELEVPYKGKGKNKKVDREALLELLSGADEDSEEDEEDEENEKSLEDMTDEELIVLAEEKEIEVSYKGKGKNKKLDREALVEALGAEEEDEDSEDEEDEEEEDSEEKALEDMTDEELIALAKEKEIEVSYKGKGKNKKIDREALIEALGAEEGDSEEEDEEETNLEDMSDDELVELAEEKEIKVPYTGKGKSKKVNRETLIELLSGDSEEEDEEEEKEEEKPKPSKVSGTTKKKPVKEVADNFSKMAMPEIIKKAKSLGFEVIEKKSLISFKKDGKRIFSQYVIPKTITLWIALEGVLPKTEGLKNLTEKEANDLHLGTTRALWEGTDVKKAVAMVDVITKALKNIKPEAPKVTTEVTDAKNTSEKDSKASKSKDLKSSNKDDKKTPKASEKDSKASKTTGKKVTPKTTGKTTGKRK